MEQAYRLAMETYQNIFTWRYIVYPIVCSLDIIYPLCHRMEPLLVLCCLVPYVLQCNDFHSLWPGDLEYLGIIWPSYSSGTIDILYSSNLIFLRIFTLQSIRRILPCLLLYFLHGHTVKRTSLHLCKLSFLLGVFITQNNRGFILQSSC
jgi:hypothetical protein